MLQKKKKSLSLPSNTVHDTIAVYEEKVTFNDNHHPKNMNKSLCLEPEEQHRALCYACLCPANSSLACLQGAQTFHPIFLLGYPWGNCLVLRIPLRSYSLQNLTHYVYFLTIEIQSLLFKFWICLSFLPLLA